MTRKLPRSRGAKSRSGPDIPEAQRHTVQLKLRLPEDVADRLRALAAERHVTVSGLVASLLP